VFDQLTYIYIVLAFLGILSYELMSIPIEYCLHYQDKIGPWLKKHTRIETTPKILEFMFFISILFATLMAIKIIWFVGFYGVTLACGYYHYILRIDDNSIQNRNTFNKTNEIKVYDMPIESNKNNHESFKENQDLNEIKNEKYYREIQTRERIMQVFLIISGFLLAYSKQSIVPLFSLFILFAILYYIYLTRTENDNFINFWGFFSSYTFSLLILHFINTQGEPLSDVDFITTFIALTAIFTFAFLSPNSSDKLIKYVEKAVEPQFKKHKRLIKYLLYLIAIIFIIISSYKMISF
jgi:hypothetical protein